jgi:hypothetical protein
MASFNDVPNELLGPIAQAIVPGAGLPAAGRNFARHADIAQLAAFVLVCRRFHQAGNPILYAKAAVRHPYLLAWAAETRNAAVVIRLLDAGMTPNVRFQCGPPRRSHEGIWPRAADPSERLGLLRASYWRTDGEVVKATSSEYYRQPGMDKCIRRVGLGYELCAEPPRYGTEGYPSVKPPYASPLHFAAANGDLDMIRVLLATGAFLDISGYRLCSYNDWDTRR